MTMQTADCVYIKKKKYYLIDVEEGKQIITCSNYIMPKHNGEITCSTACYRGYTADYYIFRDLLYGIKSEERYIEDSRKSILIKSPKTFIPYTGSCIIAYGNNWGCDFLVEYTFFYEAYELYFEKGKLKEKLQLNLAIEKAKIFRQTVECNNIKPHERFKELDKIAREQLKYKYDVRRTYKWRHNNNCDKKDEDYY